MATRILSRALLTKIFSSAPSSITRSYIAPSFARLRLRPLSAAVSATIRGERSLVAASRGFATRSTSSSLSDPNPNWSNRPPKETILLDGCDFEHWLVVLEKPEGDPTRDEIIDSYIKTLAMVVGSEEEARMKIYSVSTKHYFAFGALVSEELSYKLKELPKVRWVLPDSYLDVKNKDYGGEPFINGQAVPYDPKYHEEWVRNNARAQDRNRRNDRPRNFDRSRNFERRRENMQTQDVQTRGPPPPNMAPPQVGTGATGPNLSPSGNFPPLIYPPQSNYPPQTITLLRATTLLKQLPAPEQLPSPSPKQLPSPSPSSSQNNYSPQNNYPPRPQSNYPPPPPPPPPPQNNYSPQHNNPPQTNFPPQSNSMPPQYNAGRTPPNDSGSYSSNFQNGANGPQGSSVPSGGDNQNYGPGVGGPGGKPY
ncbi:unnamed protein product [Rhodiola kirilowii]